MGGLRVDVERLTRLLPDPTGFANGYVVTTQSFVDSRGLTQYGYTLTPGGGGGGGVTSLNTLVGALTITSLDGTVTIVASGSTIDLSVPGGGSGTVTNFSAGNLSPLFTSSVATSTTTPALTFAQVTQAANIVFAGPSSGGSANPTFRALVAADLPAGAVSPLTTKGDIYGFSTVNARIPVGTNGQLLKADSTQALGVKYADLSAGVSFRIGRQDGAVLLANFQRVFILPCAYDQITTGSWEFYTFPGSTCVIDVQYITFGTSDPTTANSIVGGTHPATSGGQTATGVTSGWTSSLARGGFIAIQVLSNDLAREIRFFMPGRKVI